MNETIKYIDEDDVLDIIAEKIKANEYEKAAEILIALNAIRVEKGYKPRLIKDVLFMRWFYLFSEFKFKEDMKSVYIAEFTDNSVKIGVSKNPKARVANLSFQKGRNIRRYCYTDPVENAFEIENQLHAMYSAKRIKGEYFKVNFEDVVMAVEDKYKLGISVSENIYKRHAMIEG